MWAIQTVVHDSAIKRNDVLIHAAACMSPENVMLSERSQTQEERYDMIPLIPRIGKNHGGGKYTRLGLGEVGNGECYLMVTVSVRGDGKVLKTDSGDGCTTM